MKRLTLKHADLSLDAERWLRIGKHNGEEIAVQLESEEPTVLAKWLEAASVRSQRKIAKRTTEKPVPKRKLMEPRGDKRYVLRNKKGELKEVEDVGRFLAADRRRKAKTVAKPGYGDKGDRPRAKAKGKRKNT